MSVAARTRYGAICSARVSTETGAQKDNRVVDLASPVVKKKVSGRLNKGRLGGKDLAERVELCLPRRHLHRVGGGNDSKDRQAVGDAERRAEGVEGADHYGVEP